ncbi:enoyl-CoA hydratase/isomerase family protein [Halalkalibacter akibai]|uniref:Ethylmalonyl-CoA decarboxylase n=1 Tax=Halalkalibacter akibai (strain ATCC 43226 / DSM 21942 / CIP 109018 / JCM 9157 / 1139) TaxID=1236973 RepID=W4QPJ9_HALA3|nr:enoyl-CoA hydratase/isomerase family protein [Halalkalibacter akibai]GAE33842.1 enoyl-CoA hydratase [Halalkalibacter akibai JCM 9157]
MKNVLIEQEKNGATWIVINRENKRNAINFEVIEELNIALTKAENDNSGIVIITGAGDRAFCSGGDLECFRDLKTKEEASGMLTQMGNILERLMFFPKITVAALNGTAVGGGCELSMACDFRVAAPHVKMGFVQGKLGITTGWGGGTILLQKIAKVRAMEMLLSANIYSIDTLVEIGVVNKIINDPFHEGVMGWISSFIDNVEVQKSYKARLLDNVDRQLISQNMKREIEQCASLWESDAHHEAVERFLKGPK